jgi:hypothetical protein
MSPSPSRCCLATDAVDINAIAGNALDFGNAKTIQQPKGGASAL